jgi:hypothetical protein
MIKNPISIPKANPISVILIESNSLNINLSCSFMVLGFRQKKAPVLVGAPG